jgi:hypothetical protein
MSVGQSHSRMGSPWLDLPLTPPSPGGRRGIEALNAAATAWGRQGFRIEMHAVFVEKDPTAFAEL